MARDNIIMRLDGAEALKKQLKKQPERFLEEMRKALPSEGGQLLSSANAQAPRVSGTLASSGLVTEASNSKRVKVAVAYTDEKAAAVHEGLHWRHFIQGTRGFKWFEKAFRAWEPGFVERVATRLRALIGR